MPNLVQSKMIVLKKTKYSESDLIIQGLLQNGLKVSLIARGALVSRKRFGGGILEPTHHISVQYEESKSEGGLSRLIEAQLIHDFSKIRTEYERLDVAFKIIDWVNRASQESGDGLESVYYLVGHALSSLESVQNLDVFRMHFMIRFLNQNGVLDHESWMEPYLKVPMAYTEQIQATSEVAGQYRFLQEKMNQYLGL